MSDHDYLGCSPVGEAVTPGREDTCELCGERVWVSRSSESLVREKNLHIACINCMMAKVREDPEFEIHPPTEEQIMDMEIWQHLRGRQN